MSERLEPTSPLSRVEHFTTERLGSQVCNGKSSKISNTFSFLLVNKMLAIRDVIHKMFVRIANREVSDQTASSEAV